VKRSLFLMTLASGLATSLLLAQDATRFNGTWKGDGGQVRKLTWKEGVVYMEETQTNGRLILRNYPTQGQEITMTEGVWKDSKAVGKMEGNKLVVDTVMPTGTKWHDEWTMAADGKTYAALRVMVDPGTSGAFAKAGAAPKKGGPPEPETFTKQ
jgi:hypothetical protein